MKLRSYPPKETPEVGDIRKEKHFAWWPRRVENKLIWLEHYLQVFIYHQGPYIDPFTFIRVPNVKWWKKKTEELIQKQQS